MNTLQNSAQRCNRHSFAHNHSLRIPTASIKLLCTILVLGLFVTGCKKEATPPADNEVQSSTSAVATPENNVLNDYTGLSRQTAWELQQARAATAKYQHIKNAIKDGYADINVVSQNMGYHYMNASLVDGTFDIRKPEILVYNKDQNGNFVLVAVEYARPLTLPRPEGFTGAADVWDDKSGFPLWLLHAWVWTYNPLGVFHSTNPLIHLH